MSSSLLSLELGIRPEFFAFGHGVKERRVRRSASEHEPAIAINTNSDLKSIAQQTRPWSTRGRMATAGKKKKEHTGQSGIRSCTAHRH